MRGNVIGFDPDTNTGAISGYDGNRYDFVTLDWRAPGLPRRGDLVDFQAIERRATEIYLLEPSYVAPSLGRFYFSLYGRISRAQYWLRFMLPYIAVVFVLELIAGLSDKETSAYATANALLKVFYLIILWPSIATLVKRIHDRNKSGWTILILFLPALVLSFLLVAWLGAAFYSAAQGEMNVNGPIGALAVAVIVLGVVVMGINLWFFIEFGCLRGTIGSNKYGPDPVR